MAPLTSSYTRKRDAEHLSDLAHRIYDASVHPRKWNEVVETIAASFGSSKGLLFTPFVAPQQGGLLFPVGIAESSLQVWASSYIGEDTWAQRAHAQGLWRAGAVLRDHEIFPSDEFLASTFYKEFLSKLGIGRVCLGIVIEGGQGLPAASISIFRDAHEPEFDDADAQWMKLLAEHISRGLGLMQRFDSFRLQNVSLMVSFDRLEFGVALLNADLQVLHLNLAAERVIDRRDGIGIGAGKRLESTPAPGRRAGLAEWFAKMAQAPVADQGHFLEECRVIRNVGKRQYAVQCASVLSATPWAVRSEEVRYVVFIIDPAALQLPSAARLVALFGLTQAQAKVAREFSKGGTYKQVARRLKISVDTVRSHIKDIYPKTRVNRQADLVRLVLSLAHSAV